MASPQRWAWSNIGSGLAPQDAAVLQSLFFEGGAPTDLYRDAIYSGAGIILLFLLLSLAFFKFDTAKYRSMSETSRLIFVSHVAFFVIFAVTTVPYSIGMVKTLFAPSAPLFLMTSTGYRSMAFPIGLQLGMYILEGGTRAVARRNNFLVLHHIMFCIFLVLAFQSETLFLIKVSFVVSCFATYEFLLYAALIARKVPVLQKHFRWLAIVGLGFYGITRVIQTVLLIGLFVFGFSPMNNDSRNRALYWVELLMSIAVSVLQLYTFVIYQAIWKTTNAKRRTQLSSNALPASVSGSKKVAPVKQAVTLSRAETGSSELNLDQVQVVELPELRRASVTAGRAGNTGTDIFNSQSLLLEDILEDTPYLRRSTDIV